MVTVHKIKDQIFLIITIISRVYFFLTHLVRISVDATFESLTTNVKIKIKIPLQLNFNKCYYDHKVKYSICVACANARSDY